jgi:hypothetical protein
MYEKLLEIEQELRRMFPGASSIKLSISDKGIKVTPTYSNESDKGE